MEYAAFVLAALALGWNVVSWGLGHLTRIKVTIEPTSIIIGDGPEETVAIIAFNKSAHPVQSLAASFERLGEDAHGRWLHLVPTPHPSQSIPGVIPARSAALRWMPREDAEYAKLIGTPIRAHVQIAHRDKTYSSKPLVIPADAWDAESSGPPRYRMGPQ